MKKIISVLLSIFFLIGCSAVNSVTKSSNTKKQREFCYAGNYKELINKTTKEIEVDPKNAEAYIERGYIYMKRGDWPEALADFNKVIELNPDIAEVYVDRGDLFIKKKENDKALKDFSKAIDLDSSYIQAYKNRASLYENNKEYDKALSDYNKAIELKPKEYFGYYDRGSMYQKKGEYDKALADYNKAIELSPRPFFICYLSLAEIYIIKSEYDKALVDFKKIFELEPEIANTYHERMGFIYENKGENDRALAEYNKAIEFSPEGDKEAYEGRARIYEKRGEKEKARINYDKAKEIAAKPKIEDDNLSIGINYFYQGDYRSAINEYNKSIEKDSKNVKAYCERGNVYTQRGDFDEALTDYNKAIELDPKNKEAYDSRATIYNYYKKDVEKALADYSKVIELDPKDTASYESRGRIYLEANEYDKALAEVCKVIELSPNELSAYKERIQIYGIKKEYDKALVDCNLIIEKEPKASDSYLIRGDIYKDKGDAVSALRDYDKAVELAPEDAYVLSVRSRILEENGDNLRAALDYEKADQLRILKNYSKNVYLELGDEWNYTRKNQNKAIEYYTKAIELDPKSSEAYLKRGIALFYAHNEEKAFVDLNRAIELDPKNAIAYMERGEIYKSKNKYDEALADYNKAIKLDPKQVRFYKKRSEVFNEQAAFDKMILDYNKIIELEPAYYNYSERGRNYALNGDNVNALLDYNKAIELHPDDVYYYDVRGDLCLKMKEYDKAIEDYDRILKIKPKNAVTFKERGDAYWEKGEKEKALLDYDKAIEFDKNGLYTSIIERSGRVEIKSVENKEIDKYTRLIEDNPKDVKAYHERGNIYIKKAEYEKALADFNKAIELNPTSGEAYFYRSLVYSYKNDYDKELLDLNKAIEVDPKSGVYYSSRGHLYFEKGDINKAITDYTKAIELKSDYQFYFYERGKVYLHNKDYDKAIEDFTKDIELEHKSAYSYKTRGDAYWEKGDREKALLDYSKAVELDKKYEYIFEVIKKGKTKAFSKKDTPENDVKKFYGKIESGAKICMLESAYTAYGNLIDKGMFIDQDGIWNSPALFAALNEYNLPVYVIGDPGYCNIQELKDIFKSKGYKSLILDGSNINNLKLFDVVVLYHAYNLRESVVKALEEYVKNGGGLVIIDGNGTEGCETEYAQRIFIKMTGMETLFSRRIKGDEIGIRVLKEHEITKDLTVSEVYKNRIISDGYSDKNLDGEVLMEFDGLNKIALKVKNYENGRIAIINWNIDYDHPRYWSRTGQIFGKYSGYDILRRSIEWVGDFKNKYYNEVNLVNYRSIGRHYILEKDSEAAKKVYKEIIDKYSTDPGSYDAYNEIINISATSNDLKSAETYCEQFLKNKPDKTKIGFILTKLRKIYINENGQQKADENIKNIITKYVLNADDLKSYNTANSFLTDWWIIGSFEKSFEEVLPPEKDTFDINKQYTGKMGDIIKWKAIKSDFNDGYMNLKNMLNPSYDVTAYAYTTVKSEIEQEVKFAIGSNDQIVIWLNNEKVYKYPTNRQAKIDQNIIQVKLNKGENKILLKVADGGGAGWGFYFRIEDLNGNPVK